MVLRNICSTQKLHKEHSPLKWYMGKLPEPHINEKKFPHLSTTRSAMPATKKQGERLVLEARDLVAGTTSPFTDKQG